MRKDKPQSVAPAQKCSADYKLLISRAFLACTRLVHILPAIASISLFYYLSGVRSVEGYD